MVLDTISCGDIAPSESHEFTYELPQNYLTLEDKMTMYGLNFKVDSDDEEINYANNTEKAVFGELTEHTVAFVDSTQLLDIVAIDEFEDYSVSKEGYTFGGWYTSPGFDENSKISNISEETAKDLTVFAEWIPMTIGKAAYENYSINVSATVAEDLLGESGVIIFALYKGNDLVAAETSEIKASINCNFAVLEASNDYTVKMFCWDSFKGLNRMCKSISQKV